MYKDGDLEKSNSAAPEALVKGLSLNKDSKERMGP